MYASRYDAVQVGDWIEFPLCHRSPERVEEVVKGGNLRESVGLCIIRVGGVNLEG